MTATHPRPRELNVAFWLLLVGAVMLMGGGLIAATAAIPAVFRGAGIICVVAGGTIAFLAGRVRKTGDPRFRRATLALSFAVVVLVSLTAALGVVHLLGLLSVLPLLVGAMLLTRPAAAGWSPEAPESHA
jgi:peptidoglycan/LPS O-acetylase OafA/YrhL